MYLIGTKKDNHKEFISNSVIELMEDVLDSKDSNNCGLPLYLLQDICRNYTDYELEPHTYWVLKNKLSKCNLPNIIDIYDKLILFNSIDKAKSINNKLGICINQVEFL